MEGLFEPLPRLFRRVGFAVGQIGRDHSMLGRRAAGAEPEEEPILRRGAAVAELEFQGVTLHFAILLRLQTICEPRASS